MTAREVQARSVRSQIDVEATRSRSGARNLRTNASERSRARSRQMSAGVQIIQVTKDKDIKLTRRIDEKIQLLEWT